jgi:hypothetical protein
VPLQSADPDQFEREGTEPLRAVRRDDDALRAGDRVLETFTMVTSGKQRRNIVTSTTSSSCCPAPTDARRPEAEVDHAPRLGRDCVRAAEWVSSRSTRSSCRARSRLSWRTRKIGWMPDPRTKSETRSWDPHVPVRYYTLSWPVKAAASQRSRASAVATDPDTQQC